MPAIRRRAERLWRLLIEPAPLVEGPEHRDMARLLAALMLVLIGLGLGSLLSYPLDGGIAGILREPLVLVTLGTLVFMVPVYVLSRTRSYRVAAALVVVTLSLGVYAVVIVLAQDIYVNLLAYLILPVILSSLFLGQRPTLLVVAANVVGLVVLPALTPVVSPFDVYVIWLEFFVIASAIIMLLTRHMVRQEQHRQAALAAANELLRQQVVERERTADELRVAEARYRTLVEQLPAAVYVTSATDLERFGASGPAKVFQYVSPQLGAMLGVPPTEEGRLQLGWLAHVHADDLAMVQQDALRFSRTHTSIPTEYRLVAADGHMVWVEDQAKVVRDNGGAELFVQGLLMDITKRKEAELALVAEHTLLAQRVAERTAELRQANEALERAARLKDEFLANMSHELRTPLNAVLGYAELLQDRHYGELNERQLRALTAIDASGRHLLSLISDILDLAKIGAGKLALELSTVSVADLCEQCIQLIMPAARERMLAVQLVVDPGLRYVQADERRLRQILLNLLNNAVKFTPSGGEVGLEVARDAASCEVRFSVWDTGIGIAPEDVGLLFQPFSQLDAGLARHHGGTGLGLALVSRLADLHGGSMSVVSEPGHGSRFTMTMPFATEGVPR